MMMPVPGDYKDETEFVAAINAEMERASDQLVPASCKDDMSDFTALRKHFDALSKLRELASVVHQVDKDKAKLRCPVCIARNIQCAHEIVA
jgi:hypothetical protein